MKCPHCDTEIPGSQCPECGETTPGDANYCMSGGELLTHSHSDEDTPENDDGFDLENRVLCPDGTCTGIMVNGRCTECGKKRGSKKAK